MTNMMDIIEQYETVAIEDIVDIFHQQCVYFLQMYDDNGNETPSFKIGYTNNLARRVEELRFGNRYELRLVNVIYCDAAQQLEQEYHKHLAPYRVHHEWFDLPVAIIKKLKANP